MEFENLKNTLQLEISDLKLQLERLDKAFSTGHYGGDDDATYNYLVVELQRVSNELIEIEKYIYCHDKSCY